MSLDVLVIGAGIAGVACASRCAAAGLAVEVVDRGYKPGGRLSTRRLREPPKHLADFGAPAFGASGAAFAEVVAAWCEAGLARPWIDAVATGGAFGLTGTAPAPGRFASLLGTRALVEHLAAASEVPVRGDRDVAAVRPGGRIDARTPRALVLAMPGPQAARLLGAYPALQAIADQPYEPALVLTAQWPAREWPEFGEAWIAGEPALDRVIDSGRARGDGAPVLVARSSPAFATAHLVDPSAATAAMVRAVRDVLGLRADPESAAVHRWTFAQPAAPRGGGFHLSDDPIGLCGDGWSATGDVEGAWTSGDALGAALAARLA